LCLRKHCCNTSTPAAVATPAAPPPFSIRLSASSSRAGGSPAQRPSPASGKRSPQLRAGPRSMCINPECG
jgi:hypothetical protein